MTPSIVFSRIGQTQTNAMMNTFIESPTPITRIANGSSAGGGIARRNSTIGAAARRARRDRPSSSPSATPTTTAIAKPRPMRTRLGTTSLPTRSNTQVSAKVERISVSGG